MTRGVEESIKRRLQLGFEISDNADDLVEGLLARGAAKRAGSGLTPTGLGDAELLGLNKRGNLKCGSLNL